MSEPIKFNDYSRDVKSLGVISWDGRRATTGAVAVGQPQVFTTTEKETITVTIGTCRINSRLVNEHEEIVVEAGKEVKIEALGPAGSSATYTCTYGDVVPMEPDVLLATIQESAKQVFKLIRKDCTVVNRFVHQPSQAAVSADGWYVWHSAIHVQSMEREPISNFIYAVAIGKEEEE